MRSGLKTSEFVGPAGLIMYLMAKGLVDQAVRIAIVWAPAYAIGRTVVKVAEVVQEGRTGGTDAK